MKDADFINFQDDLYDLLEKYGIKDIDAEHENFNLICAERDKLCDFIDGLKDGTIWL